MTVLDLKYLNLSDKNLLQDGVFFSKNNPKIKIQFKDGLVLEGKKLY